MIHSLLIFAAVFVFINFAPPEPRWSLRMKRKRCDFLRVDLWHGFVARGFASLERWLFGAPVEPSTATCPPEAREFQGRIVELDSHGKAVWFGDVERTPISTGRARASAVVTAVEPPPGFRAFNIGQNPWHPDHWNMTRQGQVVRELGIHGARTVAMLVGARVGDTLWAVTSRRAETEKQARWSFDVAKRGGLASDHPAVGEFETCDKTLECCADRFDNEVNFGGRPFGSKDWTECPWSLGDENCKVTTPVRFDARRDELRNELFESEPS